MQKVRLFSVENGQVIILGAVTAATRFPAESEARKQVLVASSRKKEECYGVLA